MFVHVLKIPTSSINHTWDVFIKHVCIDTKKIHVCITSLPLHIVFFCAIPSRPNHPNFRTKKYTPQKKHTKTQLFSYNHPTSEKKKKRDPCNWTYSKLRKKTKETRHVGHISRNSSAFRKPPENWSFRKSQIDFRAISFVEIAPLPVRMLSQKCVALCFVFQGYEKVMKQNKKKYSEFLGEELFVQRIEL